MIRYIVISMFIGGYAFALLAIGHMLVQLS